MRKSIKSVGEKFGYLVVKSIIGKNKNGQVLVECFCDCGNKTVSTLDNIRRGKVVSCGCFIKEWTKKRFTTHGLTNTKFYTIYISMYARVNNPKGSNHFRYGGRGIKLLWKSFNEFHNDMYNSYLKHCEQFGENNTSIERKNNNGHYSKENCRWATKTEQARNRRSNHFLTINNETKCIVEWIKIYSVPKSTFYYRISKLKLTPLQALGLTSK